MRRILALIIFTLTIIGCKNESKHTPSAEHDHSVGKSVVENKKVLSPHTAAMAMVGNAHVHIGYSSPGVRGRVIFGGLLAYDEVWQAGAHMATWVETNKDLMIDGKELKAGKYGFFAIPSQDEWTLIFNTHWDQHGKDEYDPEQDVMRIKVKPELSDNITEHLTYTVQETGTNEGSISLSWEKVKVQVPFNVKQ